MALDGGVEWQSYALQDFVMFGPQVFLRLFERINQDLWPWTLLAVFAALVLPLLLSHQRSASRRVGLFLLACAWGTSGFAFLVSYFGPINWPAVWFGWAFVAQAVLVGFLAVKLSADSLPRLPYSAATLWVIAVLGLPWLTVELSGEWRALALFGLAPGTTVAAGVLVSALFTGFARWLYLVIPVFWALFSAATYWGLQLKVMLIFPVATLVLVTIAVWLSPSRVQSQD